MDQKAMGMDICNHDFCLGDSDKHHCIFLRINILRLGCSAMALLVIYYLTRPNVKAFFPKLYPTTTPRK